MGFFNMEKKYIAVVKVIRKYELGFGSTDLMQANEDAETIMEDENFTDNFVSEDHKLVEVYEDNEAGWEKHE